MEKINYKLPAKAKEIIQRLADSELNQVMFYAYAAQCCLELGYADAADFFWKESGEERGHQRMLAEFVIMRGEEVEVNATDKPEIDDTDFKSILKAALEMEIKVTGMYNEAVIEMQKIDIMAYQELLRFMDIQRYAIDQLNQIWMALNADEDQYEFQKAYFGPKVAENAPIG